MEINLPYVTSTSTHFPVCFYRFSKSIYYLGMFDTAIQRFTIHAIWTFTGK